jgi:thioredoxin reductase
MERLVVVGNGMSGMACVEQILKHAPKFEITVFGDETHTNYNRILLSSVLAGEKSLDEITLHPLRWYRENAIDLKLGVRIVDVDRGAKTVTGDDGSVTPFDRLLLATGSSPTIPPIAGLDKLGVFTFRNIDDTRQLLEQSRPGRKAIVIGGGLLGLEAARGLQVQGCDVLGEKQMTALFGEVGPGSQPLHVAVAFGSVAHQNHAGEAAGFEHELFVNAQGRVFVADDFGFGIVLEVAGGEDVDAHDFELGCDEVPS